MSDQSSPAPLDVRPARRGLSLVWLVPLAALIISLGVAWQTYSTRGTLIEIAFENASGISADQTVIKYRDVDVGRVEKVAFSEGLDVVIVSARMEREVVPYLDDDAQFWVVTPDVSVRGISGLETVLSGVFIEGTWDTTADVAQLSFVGLNEPPLSRATQEGTPIVLRASDGSALATGAPVLHKGIEVGSLETPQLSPDGQSVTVNAFIDAPYDRLITTNTRFWDTSGFSLSLGAGGVSLDVDSLASLIEGGIAFDTVVSGGSPVRDGQTFNLFDSPDAARASLFNDGSTGDLLNIAVLFDGSVNGLAVGSDVRFRGITVGEVIDLAAIVTDENNARIKLRAVLGIDPTRLGMQENATPEYALDFLSELVAQGFRARLATGNILSGSLVVQLVSIGNADAQTLDLRAEPYPLMPSAPSAITDVADTADDVLQRINDLRIEDMINSAISMMNSVEAFTNGDELRQAPESLLALLDEAQALIASDDIQTIAPDIRDLLSDADALIAAFVDVDLAAGLNKLTEQSNAIAASLVENSESWPELTAQAQELLETANALELDALVKEAGQTLDTVNTLLASQALQDLPADLQVTVQATQNALADLSARLVDLDLEGLQAGAKDALASVNSVLNSVEDNNVVGSLSNAADSAARASAAIETGTESLPQIMAQTEDLIAKANALELDALIQRAEEALGAVETLLANDGTQALPQTLSDAATELQLFMEEVREGGAISNVNAALASANEAAQAIEDAASSLPALSARAAALVRQTEDVLRAYDERSRFNIDIQTTLRDIQEAADAVSALARTIQRNPNALITGR